MSRWSHTGKPDGVFCFMENNQLVRRSKRTKNFTIIGNDVIQDDRVSIEARGVLIFILSLPEDWVIRKNDLQVRLNISRRTIDKCFEEMKQFGYLCETDVLKKDGRFDGKGYVVYDYSILQDPPFMYSTGAHSEQRTDVHCEQRTGAHSEQLLKKEETNKEKPSKKKVGFVPPTFEEFLDYFRQNGQPEAQARKAFAHYNNHNWTDSQGRAVKNWKQKIQTNWFKDVPVSAALTQLDGDARMNALVEKGYANCTEEELRWVYSWQYRSSASHLQYATTIRLVKPGQPITKQDCIDADRAAGFN